MTYVRTVPESEAGPGLRALYDRVRAARGAVAHLHEAMGLRPEALESFLALDAAVLHGADAPGRLSRRERELLGLVVSHANGDNYGLTHHADAFSRYVAEPGLVPLVAAEAWSALREPHLPPREAALAAFGARLAREPATVAGADVEGLRKAGLNDAEVVDAVLTVALVSMVNRIALGLGVSREDANRAFRY